MEREEKGELPLAMKFAEQLTDDQLEVDVSNGSGVSVEMTTWETPDDGET